MDRSFLITFDRWQAKRGDLIKVIEKMPFVYNWYAFWDNTIIVVSDADTKTISDFISKEINGELRHIVIELEKKNGVLQKDLADFIVNPRRSSS